FYCYAPTTRRDAGTILRGRYLRQPQGSPREPTKMERSRVNCPRRRSFRECALECFSVPLKIIDRVKERHLSLLEELVRFNGGYTKKFSDLAEAQPLGPIPFDGECFASS